MLSTIITASEATAFASTLNTVETQDTGIYSQMTVYVVLAIATVTLGITLYYRHSRNTARREAQEYLNLGVEREEKGDRDGAIVAYTTAIKLDPKWEVSYNYRGNVYYGKGNYDSAIADYMRAIHLNPRDVYTYESRASARGKKDDYDGAIADYTKVIEFDRQDAQAYSNRADAYYKKGDYQDALQDLEKAIELDSSLKSALQPLMETVRATLNKKK